MHKNILKDLDHLEELEKENQELKEKLKMSEENEEAVLTTLEIAIQENLKLRQALDKAIEKCMKFDKCPPITCIELYDDNDNDNVCKECWKKYFMKEVFENEKGM